MGNIFTDTGGRLAREGLHYATIVSTKHVGNVQTKNYGTKDMQMFVFRVEQFNDDGQRETAEIHQQFHRSLSSKAALPKLLTALSVPIRRGMTIDFDDLVGKKLNIVVTHSKPDANGTVHANVQPLPPRRTGGAQ
jgi:hypothetical protein